MWSKVLRYVQQWWPVLIGSDDFYHFFNKFSKIAKGFQKVDMGLKKIYKSCQRVTRYQMVVKNSLKKRYNRFKNF